jgi:hypothetical protein
MLVQLYLFKTLNTSSNLQRLCLSLLLFSKSKSFYSVYILKSSLNTLLSLQLSLLKIKTHRTYILLFLLSLI